MKKRFDSGFTLIEIIIVISIILIISGIGIFNYTAVRKNMAIDLETDKIVQILNLMREETKSSGRCIGIKFKKSETPARLESAYNGQTKGCDTAAEMAMSEFRELLAVNLEEDGREIPDWSVMFVPPFGAMRFSPDALESAKIVFALKNAEQNTRTVSLEPVSGRIVKM
ncbi:prepilin-type N-terminal cleavage/methylation domain-containing protein [Candidatus Peregrinibacteria bacterium]|nr:prepilin-type N-terminal cleavage/methylation domain-containing protein [Candidatus Peregrinibacteria bacterium]